MVGNTLGKYLAVGSLAFTGIFAHTTMADAAIITGDQFNFTGNLYFTGAQFDFTGPPVTTANTPNVAGGFRITSDTPTNGTDFANGIDGIGTGGNGSILDLRAADCPAIVCTTITQAGPIVNNANPNNSVANFMTFNNTGAGGLLNFGIQLDSIQRVLLLNGDIADPSSTLNQIAFDVSGIFTDNITGDIFKATGRFTPNVEAALQNVSIAQLEANPDTFLPSSGSASYTGVWQIGRQVTTPEPSAIGGLIAFGFLGSMTVLKKKKAKALN
ncbi:hypothetical protein IQ215_08420 [Cyanobacterium stanieri LEGE 03274]|uniref:PEP-CTERM sorting domain-containing protein n=1 Tax=Cyanobacterium stanieri LEGE 03274 TaxID=1828756 RepID=A0ABR9V5D0_9CHRO|nr:hypothetical protein [Cyanobacterium stanieri]MBE9222721.1 hypothetical protein [Cyanobacterium stanieri LEGE 03274]